ncbi:DUF2809 domain-containing protein [Methylobacterium sp. J-068]|uniref:ribosomal maturation YjgA family protein n=1 Tax=Methylobacterium sp. J-068 TaxID=2836649 RepID=UPI001FB90528|nr:DUF2809 domain-containing protein [Methylobacterium sp. J-068]MCJ2037207.1 DUF2809 domain-containing protein [Methylobacterium sp. J-068]
MHASNTRRFRLLASTFLVIAAGLGLRLAPFGLPATVTKWGGSVLWGAMVYGLVGLALPSPRRRILVTAAGIAVAVELSRLVHTPELDAFRLTLAGKLLIGRVFSPVNLVAYAAGILAAALVDRRLLGVARPTGSPASDNPAVRSVPGPGRSSAADGACSADPR